MTGIIVKFKPTLFELPTTTGTESSAVTQKIARKRSADDGEADAAVAPIEKKQKIEDDLTPAAVDTSTA
jgi:hypothetical protein